MTSRFVRFKIYYPEDLGEDGSERDLLKIRFIRNMKYCDFWARNKEEHQQWVENLTKVMIRTDFHDRFTIKKALGEGSFARVYLACNIETKQQYAVKAFSKEFVNSQNKGKPSLKNEISTLMDISHPNILELYEVHETKNSLYLVCEYMEGGTLSDFLKNSTDFMTEATIFKIVM